MAALSFFSYAGICFTVAKVLPFLDCWPSVYIGIVLIVLAFLWAFLFGD